MDTEAPWLVTREMAPVAPVTAQLVQEPEVSVIPPDAFTSPIAPHPSGPAVRHTSPEIPELATPTWHVSLPVAADLDAPVARAMTPDRQQPIPVENTNAPLACWFSPSPVAICAVPLSIRLEEDLEPWAVSGPALHIGRQAL